MIELPLLWRACLAGDAPSMTSMIDRGLDPRQNDRNGENCVHMTARSGEVAAIRLLTLEGLDLNCVNHNGQTPLHVATTKSHVETVEFIVKNEGDTDITTKFSRMTALHMACKDNSVGIVRVLIDNGANCAIKDKIGKYPDFYTKDSMILSIFDTHFDTCTHGRGRRHGKIEDSTDDVAAHSPTRTEGEDDEDSHKKKKKKKSKEREREREYEREKPEYTDVEHREVEIYDKMENYDKDRAKENWDKAKYEAKKIKVNHGIDFSEEHKKRMQQNVFDRLMGGSKKKS